MGILRLLLAISVLVSHSEPLFGLKFAGGQVAVQTFYIISGFYMSMVLNEKYLDQKGAYRLFISNRILRLYPIYWLVLILSVAYFLINGIITSDYLELNFYLENASKLHFSSLLFLLFTNICIIGQDVVMFLGTDTRGLLEFVKDFSKTDPQLHGFLMIPQAWTIALEMTFYLIAPFLVRRKTWLICLIILTSLGFRLLMYSKDYNHDPWTDRFFLFELAFFLSGIISYRFYLFIQNKNISKWIGRIALCTFSMVIIFYSYIPFGGFKHLTLFGTMIIFLPFIFLLTKQNTFDRYIGEYSYPLYIIHLTVFVVSKELMNVFDINYNYLAEIMLVISLIFSALIIEFFAKKIEVIRQRRIAH